MNVFGPVPSRRLGFSLGVDIITPKYCSFDCVYCQIGKTAVTAIERRSFCDPGSIVEQVAAKVEEGNRIDFITLSGSGEPTLNADIGRIIDGLKKRVSLPIAVITNGSLLWQKDVRRDIAQADVVLPSLDAGSHTVLEKINRPHPSIVLDRIVQGLRAFGQEFKGKVWLEIMLIKDINNDPQGIDSLKTIVNTIGPDKVQLNTVTRPPAEPTIRALERKELERIARIFGSRCEVIADFEKQSRAVGDDWTVSLGDTLKRRSLTLDDIVRTTGLPATEVRRGLRKLIAKKEIRPVTFNGRRFYMAASEDEDNPGTVDPTHIP